MTDDEVAELWRQIHAINDQLAPYRQTEAEADEATRQALDHDSHDQILAAYNHRFETRHCNYTLTRKLVEERRWLISQLPKQQT